MRRRLLFGLAAILLLALGGCARDVEAVPSEASTTARGDDRTARSGDELRAVWISFYELTFSEGELTEEGFRARISEYFSDISADGLNAAFVHVRPFGDSLYPSELFPWSAILTGEQGKNPGFDPLAVILEEGKKCGIEVHAWINPFRVSKKPDLSALSADNPAAVWLSDGDESNDSLVYVGDNGIYYNPSVPETHALIIDGVLEILNNYDVAGIHIDDYFYPTSSPEIDAVQYADYLASGGELSLEQWRRENVSAFVAALYAAVKSADGERVMSISPSAKIDYNYNELYADVRLWASSEGYADIIIPQIYFGFENEKEPFDTLLREWEATVDGEKVRLAFGLAAYKTGREDEYAGTGEREWLENDDILARQIADVRQSEKYGGFVLYSYSYLWGENSNEISASELENFKNVMKNPSK